MSAGARRLSQPQSASDSHRNAPPRKTGGKNLFVIAPKSEMQITASAMTEMALLQAPVGVVVCNVHHQITVVNDIARHTAAENPIGQSMASFCSLWGELLDADGQSVPREEWPWLRALNGETVRCEEFQLITHDGMSLQLQLNAAPIYHATGHTAGAMTIIADICNNKRQEAIRQYEMLMADRTRIAGNIHDNVSQGLNASILHLRAARQEMAELLRAARTHLGKAIETSRYSLAEARRATSIYSYDLAENDDPALDLRRVAQELFAGLPVEIDYSLQSPKVAVSSAAHAELLRIGKEALTNVVKHANASRVGIALAYKQDEMILKILDNGCGFSLEPSKATASFGLVSMQHRARRMGGRVRIESQPGRGTLVVANFPV